MSIGECVVSNVTIATALALLAALVGRVTTKPQITHALWVLVLVKLVTPPVVHIPMSYPVSTTVASESSGDSTKSATSGLLPVANGEPIEPDEELGAHFTQSPELPSLPSVPNQGAETNNSMLTLALQVPWNKALVGVWIAGTMLWSLLAATRLLRFRNVLRYANPASEEMKTEINTIASRYGLRDIPRVLVADAKVPPLIWCLGRRTSMILPSGLLNKMGADERTGLIAHELAHLKRYDHWTRWFEFVVLGIYWWNPLAWWARAEVQQAEEECCDAWVLWTFPNKSRQYAQALIDTVDFLAGSSERKPETATAFNQGKSLKRRIEMIVDAEVDRRLSGKMRGGLVLFALSVAPLSLLGSKSGSTDRSEATRDEKVITKHVDNPAFIDDGSHSAKTRQVEPQTPASNEAGEVFQTALEAITNNYENLRTVDVTFEKLSVYPSVERREKVPGENENGLLLSMTVAPVFIGRSVVALEGRNLRSESYDRVGSDWNHVLTQVRKGDMWTTFCRNSNWAQRKPTADMGSLSTIDPRDFGGLDQRYGLLEQMRRSEAKSVSRTGGIAGVVAEIVNRPKYGYEPRQRFTYSFDTRRNFLPTQVIRHYGDGSINVLTELSYEEVVPGRSWFVREMTKKFFMKDVAAKSPYSDGWHQLLIYRAVGPIRINEELNDDFTIDIPPGVRIR